MPTFAEVGHTIAQNLSALNKPGVLSVRPGYRVEGGWPVGDPIIIAVVGAKKGETASYGLPAQIGGVPVEVRDASPLGRLKATRPETYAAVAERTRIEQRAPDFPFEHVFAAPSGAPAEAAAARGPRKEQIPYEPAPPPLDPITDRLSVICHASPDAGWPTLKAFFERTQQKLTVGIYDFTSAHILSGLENALTSGGNTRALSLVLDHPTRNPSADQSDEQTEAVVKKRSRQFAVVCLGAGAVEPRSPRMDFSVGLSHQGRGARQRRNVAVERQLEQLEPARRRSRKRSRSRARRRDL